MKRVVVFLLIIFSSLIIYADTNVQLENGKKVILYDDHTWAEINEDENNIDVVLKYKDQLRKGISASDVEIKTACEMLSQGWKYTMPRPKSAQAAWGNSDGRTTWYYGYWYNQKTNSYSDKTPVKKNSGMYLGDNQDHSNTWRNGGSPLMPDVYMFLLSDSGGQRF